MTARHDVMVIGGGIVGLATAWQLLARRPGLDVIVVEKEDDVAQHQSGRNSGVIHAGIYYEPGSLKAQLCAQGAVAVKEFAAGHGIPFAEPGKLIVATTAIELVRLRGLRERAAANRIIARWVDRVELAELEPHIEGLAALLLPASGVIDYARVARALAADLLAQGAELHLGATVAAIAETTDDVIVTTTMGTLRARSLVACAGLQSDRVARLAGIDTALAIVPFRGEYRELVPERSSLVRHLVYPVPDPELPFLGVHLSPTIDGRITVGPNAVLALSREGYPRGSVSVRDLRDLVRFPGTWRLGGTHWRTGITELRGSMDRAAYLTMCQRYCPDLTLTDLRPHPAGIRAQAVSRDGTLIHDFVLGRTPRSIHVLNAPSPAATSALPIGERIATMIEDLS